MTKIKKLAFAMLIMVFASCDDDSFSDKGLVLLSPTKGELALNKYLPGDSLSLEMIYKGKEQVLWMFINCMGEVFVPENTNGIEHKEYTYNLWYFGSRIEQVVINEPFTLSWVIPEDWNSKVDSPLFSLIDRYIEFSVFTENHILDYEYKMSID